MTIRVRVAVLVLGLISLGLAGITVMSPVTIDQGGNNPPQALADTTLYESFTGVTFPPSGWTVYDFNGDNDNAWYREEYEYRTSPACAAVGWYDSDIPNNDWLITPRLAIQGNDSLEFWFRGDGYNDRFKVRVCTTANVADTGRYVAIFDTVMRSTNYRRRALSLQAFAGKQAYIAWHYYTTDQNFLYFDDIAVLRYPAGPANDMGGVAFVNPPGIIPPASPVTITGVVRNFGSVTQSPGVPVGLTITGPNSYVYKDTNQVTSRSLATNQNESLAFSPTWTPPAVQGTYWLKVWTRLAGDTFANDTFTTYCYVYTGLFEQFTGDDFPPADWDTASVVNQYPWERSTDRARSAPASAKFPSYDADEGSVSWLRTPRLDLRNGGPADSLIFWWLHPPYAPHADTLETQVSFDLGGTWSTMGYLTGAMASWQRIAYNLEGGAQNDSVYIRFVGHSGFCNDLHLDDVIGPPVRLPVKDVAVDSIITPAGRFDTSVIVTPSAIVRNAGEVAASFRVFFRITSTTLRYSESLDVAGLPAGAETTLVFPEWAKPHEANGYDACCSTALADDIEPGNNAMTRTFVVWAPLPEIGWFAREYLPAGPKGKGVKDGGCLTYDEGTDGPGYVYALKGNGRYEFYQYNTATNVWATKESIPAIGRAGKKKPVKKGATMTQAGGKLYAAKGNNTLEFWQYTPGSGAGLGVWIQRADVPMAAKNVREGTGSAAVTVGDTTFIYFLRGSAGQEFLRYNTATDIWQTMAPAPFGLSGKPFKDGSTIARSDNGKVIFAVKGNYNEFYFYWVDSNKWTTQKSVPLIGSTGRKKKLKTGAGMAYHDHILYVTKGNNTLEFWQYRVLNDTWTQLADFPLGGGKRVKGGGALVYAPSTNALYATKGNGTMEFYKFGIASEKQVSTADPASSNQSSLLNLHSSIFTLRIAPNPFSTATTVSYNLPCAGSVSLKLFDVTGKLVSVLVTGYQPAGNRTIALHIPQLASGIYLLKLENADRALTSKLIIE